MDQKILQQLLEEIREIKRSMVTKDDAKNFLTKDDAKNFATKDDLKNFATKADILAINNEIKALKQELKDEIKESEAFIVGSADRNKADKSVVEDLDKRVTRIERKLAM